MKIQIRDKCVHTQLVERIRKRLDIKKLGGVGKGWRVHAPIFLDHLPPFQRKRIGQSERVEDDRRR